jgi:glycosyltransferase involved in cell wall biosynthesis
VRIFGLTMVRDEVDIIRTTILYYLAQGLDRILIVDNGSTDGTIAELQQLSRDPRVSWTSDPSGYYQQKIMTELAH